MRTVLRTPLVVFLSLALMLVLGCEYIGPVDEEDKILTPPSVREVIEDAEELDMKPLELLKLRRAAAREDLEELYQDRMDDAVGDRSIQRLERQLERALDRLDDNYDQRKSRLEARLESDGS